MAPPYPPAPGAGRASGRLVTLADVLALGARCSWGRQVHCRIPVDMALVDGEWKVGRLEFVD